MSKPFRLPTIAPAPSPEGVSLGPAVVARLLPAGAVEVRLADGSMRAASFAMPIRYEAREGDSLLVIGSADGWFVIGVLSGAGETRLEFQGDVSIRSIAGELRLRAGRAVHIDAPELSFHGRTIGMIADAVVQRFVTLRQRVTELLEVHASESRTTVEGTAYTQANRATILTREDVVINGKAIHLG